MNILFLVPWYPTRHNPAFGIFFRHQAQILARHHQVCVVHIMVNHPWHLPFRPLPEITWEQDGPVIVARCARTNFLPRLPGGYERVYADTLVQIERMVSLRIGKLDLIHANVLWPTGFAATRLGRPVVIVEHTGPLDVLFATKAGARATYESAQKADVLLAVGEKLREEMRAAGLGPEIDLLPPVVNTDELVPAPATPSSSIRLLFVGSLDLPLKRAADLVEALALLTSRGARRYELTLAGGGDRTAVVALALKRGVGDLCQFLGLIPHDKVLDAIRHCDIFVHPSEAETFGVAPAEALACGRPAVVARSGGPDTFVDSSVGAVVEPRSPEALAAAISEVADRLPTFDPQRLHQHISTKFGPEKFLEAAENYYKIAIWRHERRHHKPTNPRH